MTSMPWFRLYHRMIDDERLRLLAFEDRWHFVAVLCLKASGMIDDTHDELWERRLAVKLGLQTRELEELQRRLMGVGLIDAQWQPCKWEELQQRSDSSKERVRKYREKRKAAGMGASSSGYQRHYAALMARDGGACVYCRSTENLCIDHMVPLIQGGTDDIDNLAIACKRCNSGKAGRTPEQARYAIVWDQAADALSRYVTVTVTPQIRRREEEDKIEPKGSRARCAKPDDVSDAVWQDFKRHRARYGGISDRVIAGFRREAGKAGWTLEQAMDESITQGWRGFKAEYVKGKNYGRQGNGDNRDGVAKALDRRLGLGQPAGEVERCYDEGSGEGSWRATPRIAPM